MRENSDKSKSSLLRLICTAASDKKAENISVLRVSEVFKLADFFVICSADSTVQVGAISEGIMEECSKAGVKPLGIEGNRYNQWVLVDYGDVIVHIFYEPQRKFYDLEGLWQDAPREPVENILREGRREALSMKK